MNRTRSVIVRDGKVYHSLFHHNMLQLMEYNPVPSELKKCFKMDMFAVPNMVGFMHTTHFLLKIIYPNTSEFRDCWPIFEKSQEREFRNKATKLLRLICTDFPNFQFPEIIPSKFMSPGGFWLITIMWNLTVVAMQVQGKRDLGCSLLYKPSGKLKEINKPSAIKLLNLITRENHEKVQRLILSMESFRKGFSETKQNILDKKLKYKLNLSQLMSFLEGSESWSRLDGNLQTDILNKTNDDYWAGIKVQLEDAQSKVAKCCDLINVDVLKNQAEIIDAVKHREELGHNYVIDGKNLIDGQCNEDFPSRHLRDIDDPEGGKVIRLLDYFSKPLEELNSVKLDKKREDTPFQIENWERVHKEWEENKNEMGRLELLLNNKLGDINAKYCQERDLIAEVPESPKSIYCDSQNICTSTPIRDKSHGKLLDITPHRKPSSEDYFYETYKDFLAEASRKTYSVITESISQPSISSSTVEELRERLKKIQLAMKKD